MAYLDLKTHSNCKLGKILQINKRDVPKHIEEVNKISQEKFNKDIVKIVKGFSGETRYSILHKDVTDFLVISASLRK